MNCCSETIDNVLFILTVKLARQLLVLIVFSDAIPFFRYVARVSILAATTAEYRTDKRPVESSFSYRSC